MIKRFLTYLFLVLLVYNLASVAPIIRDLFPEGWFAPSNKDPWGLALNLLCAIVFTAALIVTVEGFDRIFKVDPRDERRFVWWLLVATTSLVTVAAITLTVWEPAYTIAINIGYWWPVYGTALFGLWASTVHLRHWRNA